MGANKKHVTPWLWSELKYDLSNGEGRTMINHNGVVANIFCDNALHSVITNAWKLTKNIQESSKSQGEKISSISTNNKDDIDERSSRSSEYNEEGETRVLDITDRKTVSDNFQYKTHWSDGDETWAEFSSFIDIDRVCLPFIQYAKKEDWEQGLMKFSQAKLQKMAISRGVQRSMLSIVRFLISQLELRSIS